MTVPRRKQALHLIGPSDWLGTKTCLQSPYRFSKILRAPITSQAPKLHIQDGCNAALSFVSPSLLRVAAAGG